MRGCGRRNIAKAVLRQGNATTSVAELSQVNTRRLPRHVAACLCLSRDRPPLRLIFSRAQVNRPKPVTICLGNSEKWKSKQHLHLHAFEVVYLLHDDSPARRSS